MPATSVCLKAIISNHAPIFNVLIFSPLLFPAIYIDPLIISSSSSLAFSAPSVQSPNSCRLSFIFPLQIIIMVSSPFLPSLISRLRLACTRKSCARVFSDTPSPSQAFEADLVGSLQKLTHGDLSSSDLISFNWMCKALDVVISSQACAKQALHSHAMSSVAAQSNNEMSKVMEPYMEDSAKMLDACCLLKDALAGVNAYVKASHLALQRMQGLKLLHQGDIERAKHDLLSAKHMQERVLLDIEDGASVRTNMKHRKSTTRRLTACSSMLRRMGDKLTAAPMPAEPHLHLEEANTASMVSSALYGGEMCTLFFLRFFSAALSSPASCSRESSSLMTPLHISRRSAWTSSLLSLQSQLNSQLLQISQTRTQGCITLLPEIHTLEAFMSLIYATLLQVSSSEQGRNDLKQLVDSTGNLICSMQMSMARLEDQIECVFSSLVDTRMAMLD